MGYDQMWCWSMIFSNIGLTLATIDIGESLESEVLQVTVG